MKAWVAKDYDGEIGLFLKKPVRKQGGCWVTFIGNTAALYLCDDDVKTLKSKGINPKIKDKEPIEIEITF